MPRVFLSHAGIDTKEAHALAERLRNVPSNDGADGIEVFFDKDHMAVGKNWQKQLEDEILERCDCFVVYVGGSGIVNWVEREVRLALNRAGQDPGFKFISIIETSKVDISDLPGFMREYQACSNVSRDADQFQRLVTAIYDEDGLTPTPITQDPFLGLNAFSIKDAHLFFGRDEEIQDTLSILKKSNLLMVVGDSGSGKSSLVKAGLLPAYLGNALASDNERSEKIWSYLETRPTDRPIEALANSIATYARGLGASQDDINTFRDMVRSGECARVRDALSDASPEQAKILLIIDQFEEVFSLANDEERDKYIEIVNFLSDVDDSSPIKVVITMRRDYYNLCSAYKALFAKLENKELVAKYSLRRMPNQQLESCIREPLKLAGAAEHCSDEFVNEVISDVGDQPGDLALLELALRETWLLHRASKMDLLSCYSAIGKTAGALAKKADEVYTSLDQHQQGLAQAAFIRLVQLGDTGGTTRRVASRQEFDDASWTILSQFASEVGGRLVTISTKIDLDIDQSQVDPELMSNDHEEPHCDYVEISHEALVRQWPHYQSWLQSMSRRKRIQDRFLKKFHVWRKGRKSKELLLTKHETQEAKHLLRSQIGWLNQNEKEYLEHSSSRHKKQALLSYSLIGLLVLAIIISVSSKIQSTLLDTKYRRQLITSNDHLSQFLLERVDNQDAQIDKLPYLLKALSLDTSSSTDSALLKKHREVARRLVAPSEYQQLQSIHLPTEQPVLIDANRNGFIARVSKKNQIVLYDTISGDKVGEPINSDFKALKLFVFKNTDYGTNSSKQITIVLIGRHRIEVRNLDSGRLLTEYTTSVPSISNTHVSLDGKTLVSASLNGPIKVWTLNNSDQVPHTFEGHPGMVNSLAISPDGKTLVSGSLFGPIKVWNLDNKDQAPHTFEGHSGMVNSLAISPDGKTLVSGSHDDTIKVWDLDNRDQPPHTFEDHRDSVSSLAISPDGNTLVSGSDDKTIKVWNLDDKDQAPYTLQEHSGSVYSLAISPDGNTLFSGSGDENIKVWNLDNRDQPPRILEGHSDSVYSLAISPDAKTLISRSRDGIIKVWNLDNNDRASYTFEGIRGLVSSLEISSDNSTLAIGTDYGTVKVWKLGNKGQLPDIFDGHRSPVRHLAISLDGNTMVSSSGYRAIKVWNLDRKDQPPGILEVHSGLVRSLAISPDGNSVVSGLHDGTIKVWNLVEIGESPQILGGHGDSVRSLAISPDGNTLVSGSNGGTVKAWNLNKQDQSHHTFEEQSDSVMSLAISPDGNTLVSGLLDGTIKAWNLDEKDRDPDTFEGHTKGVLSLAISPDGNRLVSGSDDGSIKVWNLDKKGQALNTFEGNNGSVLSLAISPDGNRLVSGSRDEIIKVWNLEHRDQAPYAFSGYMGAVYRQAVYRPSISPDGQILVSGSRDGTIKVWNLDKDDQPPLILDGHSGKVESFAISPDGNTLVSGSDDGIIMVWNLENKEQAPRAFEGHTKEVMSFAISHDGNTLVSGAVDGTIKIWDLDHKGRPPVDLKGHSGWVYRLAISPDGNTLVSGTFDGVIKMWNLDNRDQPPHTLKGQNVSVDSLAIGPDGHTLASGSNGGSIKVWDLNNKDQAPYTLKGHRDSVFSLAISPDGNSLVSGSNDGIIKVWNLDDLGQIPHTFNGHSGSVFSLSISPDGNTLVSGSYDMTIKAWNLSPALALFEFDRWSVRNKDQLQNFFDNLALKVHKVYDIELDNSFQITTTVKPFKSNLYERTIYEEKNSQSQYSADHFGLVPYYELIRASIEELDNTE